MTHLKQVSGDKAHAMHEGDDCVTIELLVCASIAN
jgi:hypothetical protein